MSNIIGYALFFMLSIFAIKFLIALIMNKLYGEEKNKDLILSIIIISILEIFNVFLGISNLYGKNITLCLIYIIALICSLIVSGIFNKMFISKFLFCDGVILLFFTLFGMNIEANKFNIFKNYLVSLNISQFSLTDDINYMMALICAILLIVLTILLNVFGNVRFNKKSDFYDKENLKNAEK